MSEDKNFTSWAEVVGILGLVALIVILILGSLWMVFG